MNPPKCNEYDYISFLMASPKVFSCTEAGKVQPDQENGPAHDPINRLLYRLPANAKALRDEAVQFADLMSGVLIVDDSASDKLYALKIEPVTRHRSGKHHNIAVFPADISESGTRVHLKGYGFIKVFRIVARNGDIEHRATDDPDTDATQASSTI